MTSTSQGHNHYQCQPWPPPLPHCQPPPALTTWATTTTSWSIHKHRPPSLPLMTATTPWCSHHPYPMDDCPHHHWHWRHSPPPPMDVNYHHVHQRCSHTPLWPPTNVNHHPHQWHEPHQHMCWWCTLTTHGHLPPMLPTTTHVNNAATATPQMPVTSIDHHVRWWHGSHHPTLWTTIDHHHLHRWHGPHHPWMPTTTCVDNADAQPTNIEHCHLHQWHSHHLIDDLPTANTTLWSWMMRWQWSLDYYHLVYVVQFDIIISIWPNIWVWSGQLIW